MTENHSRGEDRDGWLTTHMTKKAGYLRCNEILNERRMKFYERMFTVRGSPVEGMTLRQRIVQQLRAFLHVTEPRKNGLDALWAKSREAFTGKRSGPDDLAVVVQMALLIMETYRARREDKYEPTSEPRMRKTSLRYHI